MNGHNPCDIETGSPADIARGHLVFCPGQSAAFPRPDGFPVMQHGGKAFFCLRVIPMNNNVTFINLILACNPLREEFTI